jgi:hypothetical protein
MKYIIIIDNDPDEEAPFALATRRVFDSFDDAEKHAQEKTPAFRNPRVVVSYFDTVNSLNPRLVIHSL